MRKGHRFSVFSAWALAFGCALGWDALVLPWTEFLPKAGPLGTVVGLIAGGAIMGAVAWNYHFMINRCPGPGGSYAYVTKCLGVDRGFLCGWFLCFAYVSIIWLDATVLSYFLKHAFGLDFSLGFRYAAAGYEISLSSILISAAATAVAAVVCCRRRAAGAAQSALAAVFALCVLACFLAAVLRHRGGLQAMAPAFAPNAGVPGQIAGIVLLSPWLFVGFESISHTSGEFGFPLRRSFGVMASAILAVVVAYILLSLIPALVPSLATGADRWPEAVAGIAPRAANDAAYGTVGRCFGPAGRIAITVTFMAAVFTNLIGNTVAASRLLAAMADDNSLPAWLGRRNADGSPANAVIAISTLSVFIFLLGETVIGIVVDIALLGAALAYAYTSSATFATARKEGDRLTCATGLFGAVISGLQIVLFVLPIFSSHLTTMATESILVVACWCIAGLMTFLSVFHRDRDHRFGKSPVVWVVFLATIVFMSLLWVRQATYETVKKTFDGVAELHSGAGIGDGESLRGSLDGLQSGLADKIMRNNYVQTSLSISALALMLCILRIIRRREREEEAEKARAKSYFFSTVSHDIRTPLNAIIGFSEMMKAGFGTEAERGQAVDSILVSGKTLLALVNDVLDLSKLEAGKMKMSPEPTDCTSLLRDIMEAFRAAGAKPGVELRFGVDAMPPLMIDPQRLRQIAFNLLGNAVKFTEKGSIELRASFEHGVFTMSVEDTGCGISANDLKNIASPYVQVGTRNSRNGGTGLGLAICKQLASAMGGELSVKSELGRGSTFTVTLRKVEASDLAPAGEPDAGKPAQARTKGGVAASRAARILIVDDSPLNLKVLNAHLRRACNCEVVEAADGREALAALRAPGARPFDLVLSDLWMPNMDGEALVRAIREDPALAALRVIAVTADVELRGKSEAAGFDGMLLKPITTESLNALLGEVM